MFVFLFLFGSVRCFRSPTPPTHAPGPPTPFPPTGAETLGKRAKKCFVGKAHVEISQAHSLSLSLPSSSPRPLLVGSLRTFFFFFNLDSHAAFTLPSTPICVSLGSPFQVRTRQRSAHEDHTHAHTHARARSSRRASFGTTARSRERARPLRPRRAWAAQCCMRNHDAGRTRRRRNVYVPSPDHSELEHQPDEQEARVVVANTDAQQATTTVRCSPSQRRGQQQSAG